MYTELAKKVLERMRNIEFDKSFADIYNPEFAGAGRFQWSTGVGLYGAWRLYEVIGDNEILDYLTKWFDNHFKKGLPRKTVNTACPFLTLAYMYEKTKNKEYLPYLEEWSHFLYAELPRTQEGGFVHLTGDTNEGQLWMDTLFMSVLFLAKYGVMSGRDEYIREAERQILIHTKYLFDKSSGLFFHGFNFNGMHNFSNALWGRGNGWYATAIPEFLEIVGDKVQSSASYLMLESWKTQMKALRSCQENDGMWHTLLDDKSSYLESTGTTAFAYAMLGGVSSGTLDSSYKACAENAVNAIVSRTEQDGTVRDASGGTPIFETLEEYKNVVKVPIVYEQGLALMLYSLCIKLKKENINL